MALTSDEIRELSVEAVKIGGMLIERFTDGKAGKLTKAERKAIYREITQWALHLVRDAID